MLMERCLITSGKCAQSLPWFLDRKVYLAGCSKNGLSLVDLCSFEITSQYGLTACLPYH
jgi:hypothetical protein